MTVSLWECLAAIPVPAIEVHLSNVYAGEFLREHSVISPIATVEFPDAGQTVIF